MSSYRHQPPSPTTCSALYTTLRQSVSVHRFYAAVYHNGCHTNSELDPPGAVESLLFTQSSPDEIPFLRYQTFSLSTWTQLYSKKKRMAYSQPFPLAQAKAAQQHQPTYGPDLAVRLICPDCRDPNPNIIEEFGSGDLVCGSCGLVLGDRVVDTRSEWRVSARSCFSI